MNSLIYALWRQDAKRKYRLIAPFLSANGGILEIGSGPGSLVEELRSRGRDPFALDIADLAYKPQLRPVLYDGQSMPFADQQFDTALLMTVLHHANHPEQVLREAKRVAKQVVVMEDVFTNPLQRKLTHLTDSLTNWEFAGHPHNNRTDPSWVEAFQDLGFTVEYRNSFAFMAVFRQAVYVLRS